MKNEFYKYTRSASGKFKFGRKDTVSHTALQFAYEAVVSAGTLVCFDDTKFSIVMIGSGTLALEGDLNKDIVLLMEELHRDYVAATNITKGF